MKNSRALNLAIWLGIAVITVLTIVVTVWASHQPGVRSIWAPE